MYRQQVNRRRLRRHRAETTVRLDPATGRATKVTTLPGMQQLMGTWRGHADIGKPRSGIADTPQLLLYEDVLVARNGSKVVSLLPRTGG